MERTMASDKDIDRHHGCFVDHQPHALSPSVCHLADRQRSVVPCGMTAHVPVTVTMLPRRMCHPGRPGPRYRQLLRSRGSAARCSTSPGHNRRPACRTATSVWYDFTSSTLTRAASNYQIRRSATPPIDKLLCDFVPRFRLAEQFPCHDFDVYSRQAKLQASCTRNVDYARLSLYLSAGGLQTTG
jgi:hypothetical protein